MPYEKDDGTGYDWVRSAGWVEGNTNVTITGGHILTCVYGGNEYTDVGRDDDAATGKCTVTMSGGTIGVPRTESQIKKHPVTCYLFGAGKGDPRTHFNTWTNVNSVEVNVTGGIVYGSVFGGGEDGHVLGNVTMTIGEQTTTGEGDDAVTTTSGPTIGTTGTSYVDGNVFGGGRGYDGKALTSGSIGGNVELNITGGTMLGSVYGGGRLASVGVTFESPYEEDGTPNPMYGLLQDETGEDGDPVYGHVTVNISGGIIGKTFAEPTTGEEHSGNVFGGSMGRNTFLDGSTNPYWPKMGVVKLTEVNISGGTIHRNVYGGGELAVVRNRATVTMSGGTVNGSVFGGGYGSSDHTTRTPITAGGYSSISTNDYYTFTPMIWNGCVSGNTNVNISGGTVKQNVYGGGYLASVGLINFNSDADGNWNPEYLKKHEDLSNSFALSWPYEFQYIAAAPMDAASVGGGKGNVGGKATVTITGGHIGSTTWNDGTGYVFGGSKGQVQFDGVTSIAEQRYTEAFCANVRETEVIVNYTSVSADATTTSSTIGAAENCIMGAVYGGGEDGHVYKDAKVDIKKGLIGLSVYGAGKGISTYEGYLRNQGTKEIKSETEDLYSWTAGKVYGNATVTMSGGHVLNNVYGGGYLGSVGKGNYSGGADDYYPDGYGETLTGNLWTSTTVDDGLSDSERDNAWHFLNSGKATVTITGGTVGTLNGTYGTVGGSSDVTPTGMVFGGSRGQAAQDVGALTPRYEYAPNFYLGYVNETEVTIGNAGGGPRIYSQVFGGGRDGHVRGSAHVIVNNGTIGQTYAETEAVAGSTADYQRYHRGNVYGSGSGLGMWETDHHGTSSGSVTRNTTVDINGGTIYNNVYGGGALSTVGPPKITMPEFAGADWSKCVVNINGGTIGQTADYDTYQYGGCVYGASRGIDFASGELPDNYATALWTEVNINGGDIAGNVYGGAKGGQVKKDTKVNLTGGRIYNNAYGGGQGTANIAADVLGNTTVELNKGKAAGDNGCIVKRIFGCNDLNGTPKGHALVHVYATQHSGETKIVPAGGKIAKFKSMEDGYTTSNYTDNTNADDLKKLAITVGLTSDEITAYETAIASASGDNAKKAALDNYIEAIADRKYDVLAVYGGGDLAIYKPTDLQEENTDVIIDGCDLTSIKQVYGGGNAASTPANRVRINAAYEIHEAFGGGNGKDAYELNGKWYENPGANVGYYATFHHDTSGEGTQSSPYTAVANEDADTPEERRENTSYHYGKGTANLIVTGGRVHTTYGGSNIRGNVRAEVVTSTENAGDCTLEIDKSYPAGKNADTDASSKLDARCVDYQPAIYGGAQNANVYSDVVINITNGTYGAVYGGNDTSGKIMGSITINVQEEGCKPIVIGELFAGGKGVNAPYSIYGYKGDGTIRTKADYDALTPEEKAAIKVQRDPQINIISATKIGTIYGGGDEAKMYGSPTINVNMENGFVAKKYVEEASAKFTEGDHPVTEHDMDCSYNVEKIDTDGKAVLKIGTIGSIYGGGKLADIEGDTHVEIGTGEWMNSNGQRETISPARNAATITGNIFGGGKGAADTFECEKAMVGKVNSGEGSTSVVIGNGSVAGNVYGGGEIGRVEKNTVVTIGVEGEVDDDSKFKPVIEGSVFGAGKGVATHGYSGLTRGNSTVTIQGLTKVLGSIYGGGEKATVGRYNVNASGIPVSNESGGECTVTVKDNAEIGPDNMQMTAEGGPEDAGHVFGAGKGVTPYEDGANPQKWSNTSNALVSVGTESEYLSYIETLGLASNTEVTISGNAFVKGSVYGGAENGFVQKNTHVTIDGDCQIGNGYVQMDAAGEYLATKKGVNRRYTDPEWAAGHLIDAIKDGTTAEATGYTTSLPECASWPYGQTITYEGNEYTVYAPHDKFAASGTELYADGTTTNGGRQEASDGHTFYGNVFGGGSGYYPYAPGKWHEAAGSVGGNTVVDIKGGHILTNIYGGNEMTNVTGNATVNFGGNATLGVPRTIGQIEAHPVTCYLFGAGKGDTRVFFNKRTNIQNAIVNITGGTIYGSVFGGGEDGHVLGNVTMNISNDTEEANHVETKIGTWGTSYVDGNVFGGGRGFTGDAYTAGNVAGSVTMNISGGTMLGSIYGGGRLGSVGYDLKASDEEGYGEMSTDANRGHVEINISGGTIGNDLEFVDVPSSTTPAALDAWKATNHVPKTAYETTNNGGGTYTHRLLHTRGGNVYAGGMGRREKLDGSENNYTGIDWRKLGNVKSTKLTITGGTIKSNVYGGGEYGAVRGNHMVDGAALSTEVNISNATIGSEIKDADDNVVYTFGSVYGGGTGDVTDATITTSVANAANVLAAFVTDSTRVTVTNAKVKGSVFGGAELASVGGSTQVTISGENTEIGRNEVRPKDDPDNPGYVMFGGLRMGNVYGGGRGSDKAAVAGLVQGNTNVLITGGHVYHNVYGGGALGSVGSFFVSGADDTPEDITTPENIPTGVPYWSVGQSGTTGAGGTTTNTGLATVTITGGTIGISGRDNGMVFGSSRGDIAAPTGSSNPMDPYNKVAWVRATSVNIGTEGGDRTTPLIKGSVYGGGENGHNYRNATVNINSGTIGIADVIPGTVTPDPWWDFGNESLNTEYRAFRGNVYGAGDGFDTYTLGGKEYHSPRAGMVGGSTVVNIRGGHIGRSVYGAGAMASVGNVTNVTDTIANGKHSDDKTGFALSWPYKFEFAPTTGRATVNVTGGHIGTLNVDGGDIYGSARGLAGDRYLMAHMAYANETEVNIDYPETYKLQETATEDLSTTIDNNYDIPCVTGSVHGSGENGYVYGDAKVTLNKGLVGHSLYGAGKGSGQYTVSLSKIVGEGKYDAKVYGLLSGKVLGNTYVTMNDGHVVRNVYGGGNLGSVGKGNYAGGTDDYFPAGYGEKIDEALWTPSAGFNPNAPITTPPAPGVSGTYNQPTTNADYFLSSGKATVKILGGMVGDPSNLTLLKNNLPYGNVFGGSAGEAAPNVPTSLTPRYEYCPAFFSGYVNETDVIIGKAATAAEGTEGEDGYKPATPASGPTILGSVYG